MKPISEYTDAKQLRQVMKNAKRLGRDDIYWQAFDRLCAVEGSQYQDSLEREFHSSLAAYEELLTIKNGRTTAASRTRMKLRNKGIIHCLEDWALAKTSTAGFVLLMDNGLQHLTAEALVIKYSDRFSSKAVAAANARIDNYITAPEVAA